LAEGMNHEIHESHEKKTGTDFLNRWGHALSFRVFGVFRGFNCFFQDNKDNMLDSSFSPNYGRFMKMDKLHSGASIICGLLVSRVTILELFCLI